MEEEPAEEPGYNLYKKGGGPVTAATGHLAKKSGPNDYTSKDTTTSPPPLLMMNKQPSKN